MGGMPTKIPTAAEWEKYISDWEDVIGVDLGNTVYEQMRKAITGPVAPENLEHLRTLADHAAKSLVRDMSHSQLNAIGAILSDWVKHGKRPKDAGRKIEEFLRLDPQRALRLQKYTEKLAADGITGERLRKLEMRMFEKLRRDRGEVIGHTEGAYASEAARAVESEQYGAKQKVWITGEDERVCDVCGANEAAGIIAVSESFPSGHNAPPAHPRCRCTVSYFATEQGAKAAEPFHIERIEATRLAREQAGKPPIPPPITKPIKQKEKERPESEHKALEIPEPKDYPPDFFFPEYLETEQDKQIYFEMHERLGGKTEGITKRKYDFYKQYRFIPKTGVEIRDMIKARSQKLIERSQEIHKQTGFSPITEITRIKDIKSLNTRLRVELQEAEVLTVFLEQGEKAQQDSQLKTHALRGMRHFGLLTESEWQWAISGTAEQFDEWFLENMDLVREYRDKLREVTPIYSGLAKEIEDVEKVTSAAFWGRQSTREQWAELGFFQTPNDISTCKAANYFRDRSHTPDQWATGEDLERMHSEILSPYIPDSMFFNMEMYNKERYEFRKRREGDDLFTVWHHDDFQFRAFQFEGQVHMGTMDWERHKEEVELGRSPYKTHYGGTLIHEFIHGVDWVSGDYEITTVEMKSFWDKRTRGKPDQNLGYGTNEIYKDGGFMDNYAGKIYPNGLPMEMVTMGMQWLTTNPIEFAERDPEFFDLMWRIAYDPARIVHD